MAKKKNQNGQTVVTPTEEEIARLQAQQASEPETSAAPDEPAEEQARTDFQDEPVVTGQGQAAPAETVEETAPAATPSQVIARTPAPAATPAVVDPIRVALGNSYKQQEKSFADYLQGIKDDYERERQAAQQEVEQDRQAARWTGATELASAIANMIGVGSFNAANQQYKSYSQNWMQKADRDAREHRNRLDNIRQRQRETELKMAQLRSQGGLALAQYDANKRQQDIQNAMAAQKAALDAQYKAETERLKAKATADYNAGRLANDTMRARASAASSYSTATYNKERTNQLRKSGGEGSNSDLTLTFDTTDDIPGEKIRIKDQSLLRTIEANVDSFNDEDQKAVTRILNNYSINSDEKARQLLPYIKNSSRMRDLVRNSATSTEAYGAKPKPKKEEETTQTTSGYWRAEEQKEENNNSSRSFWGK